MPKNENYGSNRIEPLSQSTPLISIITVCFNSAKTIRQTIESVLNQTYTNIEYILVDGKSTDNTVEIIKEYEPKFAEKGIIYRWISEQDNGIYDAMNKGIKMATGEWIGIINSDDWYELLTCNYIAKESEKYNSDVIYGITLMHKDNQPLYVRQFIHTEWDKFNCSAMHPSVFIKNSIYSKIGLYDTSFKLAADVDLTIRLTRTTNYKIRFVPIVLSNFRIGGASSSQVGLNIKEVFKVMIKNGISISVSEKLAITLYTKLKRLQQFLFRRIS